MHYISWVEDFDELGSAWDPATLGAEEINGPANADDLSEILDLRSTALAGRFPFLGKVRNEVLVNSNGWLQFDDMNNLPCQYIWRYIQNSIDTFPIYSCWQTGYTQYDSRDSKDYNSSYLGGIAVYLSDLYPAYSYPVATIKWSNTSDSDGIIVHWIKNPFYGMRDAEVTAHARMRQDGHISIYWETLNFVHSECEAVGICTTKSLIAGIRNSVSADEQSFLMTTQAQDDNAAYTWATKVKGVYPHSGVSSMQQGKLFHMCPFSDSWSLTPDFLQQSIASNVTLYTLYSSCEAEFANIECSFASSTSSSPTTYTSVAHFIRPDDGEGYPRFTCEVPTMILATIDVYTVDLRGVFTSAVTADDGSTTFLSLLPQVDVDAGSFALGVVAGGDGNLAKIDPCVATAALSLSAAATGCGACTLSRNLTSCVTGDFTCPSVESPVDCQGNCPAATGPVGTAYAYDTVTLMKWSWSARNFFYKDTSICCNVTDIDCAGECHGGRQIAPTLTNVTVGSTGAALYDNQCCDPLMLTPDGTGCCFESIPDCWGNCGGNATVDCMGVCVYWHSEGTWPDCNGICGGSSIANICGDCYNASYAGAASVITDKEECLAKLDVTNPDPYTDLTTADNFQAAALRHINITQYATKGEQFLHVSLGLSYQTHILSSRGEAEEEVSSSSSSSSGLRGREQGLAVGDESKSMVVKVEIKNERPFALNISVNEEHSQYSTKVPTLLYDAAPFELACCNATHTIEVTVDYSQVFDRPTGDNTGWDWGIKPLTITSKPVLHGGMISTTNIELYDLIFYPWTTDCETINDHGECGYAPKCIYCVTSSPGRSLQEVPQSESESESETESDYYAQSYTGHKMELTQQSRQESESSSITSTGRSLFLVYTTEMRPNTNKDGPLGGFCASGFEQDTCNTLIAGLTVYEINTEYMKIWMPIFFIIIFAAAVVVKLSIGVKEQ
jgi:hypothetical protein